MRSTCLLTAERSSIDVDLHKVLISIYSIDVDFDKKYVKRKVAFMRLEKPFFVRRLHTTNCTTPRGARFRCAFTHSVLAQY